MQIMDLVRGQEQTLTQVDHQDGRLFFLCTQREVPSLQPLFGFDQGTIEDCLNYDENIRLTSFRGYDFISLIFFWLAGCQAHQHELNLYVGENYLVLVKPDDVRHPALSALFDDLWRRAGELGGDPQGLAKLYYTFFDRLIFQFAQTLETIEDQVNETEQRILHGAFKGDFARLTALKQSIYTIKKHLRPLLYVGDQFLVNENGLIPKEYLRFFKGLDIRLNKIYDFAVSLAEYANQTLFTYDTKLATQTNDVVNKLTILTIFIGPLTVITGIYGMNFTNMPELSWTHGYGFALLLMLAVSAVLYWVLKKKRWL